MKDKVMFFAMLLLTGFLSSPLVSSQEEGELERRVPLSWQQAAASWRMTLEAYKAEADRILDKTAEGSASVGKDYAALIPVFNPYATLDPQVVIELKKSFPTEADYDLFIRTQEDTHPKFTFPK